MLLVLAAIGFAQASFAFSYCELDRAALAATMRSAPTPCAHDRAAAKMWIKFENRCFAHCTADLQTVGHPVALLRSPADAPVLAVLAPRPLPFAHAAIPVGPPATPPPRILFRTFLI